MHSIHTYTIGCGERALSECPAYYTYNIRVYIYIYVLVRMRIRYHATYSTQTHTRNEEKGRPYDKQMVTNSVSLPFLCIRIIYPNTSQSPTLIRLLLTSMRGNASQLSLSLSLFVSSACVRLFRSLPTN